MLKGHVFKEQIFNVEVFAYFIDTFLNGKCGIGNYGNKMEVSYNGSNVTIQDGLACIRGRFIEEDSSTTLEAGTDSAFCSLIIEIDLDKENTEEQLNQASYKIVKSTNSYPALTQTDIVKNNAGIYQHELARFKTSANGITDFRDTRTFIDFNSVYTEIQTEYRAVLEELKAELVAVKDGSAYMSNSRFVFLESGFEDSTYRKIAYPAGFDKNSTIILGVKARASYELFWRDMTARVGFETFINLTEDYIEINNATSGYNYQIAVLLGPAG
jgi:hypothetical protein